MADSLGWLGVGAIIALSLFLVTLAEIRSRQPGGCSPNRDMPEGVVPPRESGVPLKP